MTEEDIKSLQTSAEAMRGFVSTSGSSTSPSKGGKRPSGSKPAPPVRLENLAGWAVVFENNTSYLSPLYAAQKKRPSVGGSSSKSKARS